MANNKKLILIVDDILENRKLLGNFLIENGYDVGTSADGKKALAFIENELPDLILLDVIMPVMDGFEVCKKIKSNSVTRHIPIIFLTAKTDTVDVVKGFKLGGVDYISKPFHNEELLARVNTHVELKILRGFLPICSSCKSIRNDDGYWQSIENYIQEYCDIIFSHSLCNKCADELYSGQEWYEKHKNK